MEDLKNQIKQILDDTLEAKETSFMGLAGCPYIDGKEQVIEKIAALLSDRWILVNEKPLK